MPVVKHGEIVSKFRKCWPRNYNASDPSDAMTPESADHTEAMSFVIDAIWPSTTQLKIVNLSGLSGKPTRPEFHEKRFQILINYLREIWSLVVPVGGRSFASIEAKLIKYLQNRVCQV